MNKNKAQNIDKTPEQDNQVDVVVIFLGWLNEKYPDVHLTEIQSKMLKSHFSLNEYFTIARGIGKTFLFDKVKEFEKEKEFGWSGKI